MPVSTKVKSVQKFLLTHTILDVVMRGVSTNASLLRRCDCGSLDVADRYCRRLKRPYNPITAPPTRKIVPAVPPMTPPATIAPTPTTIRATSWLSAALLRAFDSVETAATLDGASRIPMAAASMVGPPGPASDADSLSTRPEP